jgi:hypothetical protein
MQAPQPSQSSSSIFTIFLNVFGIIAQFLEYN